MTERGERYKAKQLGMSRYFTGRPCKYGHISERKVYDGKCIECNRIADRKIYWNNPQKARDERKMYFLANPEKGREAAALWRKKYPERYIESNRKNSRKAGPKWAKKNPDKKAAHKHARRARERGAEGIFTADDIVEIRNAQKNLCAICNIDLRIAKENIDHIIPLSRGGSNWPSNLQLLCKSCNSRKGAKIAA